MILIHLHIHNIKIIKKKIVNLQKLSVCQFVGIVNCQKKSKKNLKKRFKKKMPEIEKKKKL